jgi:HK97 family phage prohead protease
MTMKLLDADAFRAAVKDGGQQPEATLFKFATAEPQQVGDEASRTQRFVFSDATVDHSGDSIDPKGWDLGIFKRNPVALFSHMSWEPPIGRASNVSVQGGELVGDIEFATPDIYEFADTIYRLVKGKFLNAVSVGFLPKEWAFTSDKNRPYGIDFKKQTLLEISVCPVPCNPNALGEARSMGVDTRPLQEWAEKVLDSGDTIFMPRKDIEALRLQARTGAGVQYYIQGDRDVSAKGLERMRESFKRWSQDHNELLILEPGYTLRAIEETKAGEDWKCGAARDLPLDEEGAWDGGTAEASIFEHAGGDDFDPAEARKGFLAYDASAPKLRGSYKLPFARVADGKLTAMASGIRAAASRLPQSDIPDSVKETGRAVLDHYEAMMKPDKSVQTLLLKIDSTEIREAVEVALKAGRRVSAATKAMLERAMSYHAMATDCIKSVLDDEPDDEVEEGTDLDDGGGTPEPSAVGPDDPVDMTPEEKRLAEVARLKASLPTNN